MAAAAGPGESLRGALDASGYRRLVLSFDVNKTIVIEDKAGGASTEDMIESILSELCWGRPPAGAAALAAAAAAGEARDENDVVAMAGQFDFLAGREGEAAPGPQSSSPAPEDSQVMTYACYLEDYLRVPKAARRGLKRGFVSSGIGAALFTDWKPRLLDALRKSEGADDEEFHFILPSFFRLVQTLEREEVPFNIVFRSFGVDLPDIAEIWNTFCEGRQPGYESSFRADGTAGTRDRCVEIAPYRLQRTGELPEGVALYAAGALEKEEPPEVEGLANVWNHIRTLAEQSDHAFAIQDDYPWWARNNESETSGKLLLVPGSAEKDALYLLFDDNIERDRAHIVDVRDADTGEPMSFDLTQDRFAIRSDPFEAILSADYFVDRVRGVLQRHAGM